MLKEKIKIYLPWAITVICMGVIFWLSSRTAEESTAQSDIFVEWITEHFGKVSARLATIIVRKGAHCLEFTGLCVLFNWSLYNTKQKLMPICAALLTSLYAITDEIHQIFVEGRACMFIDWVIDTVGALLGAVGFLMLFAIINAIIRKYKSHKALTE